MTEKKSYGVCITFQPPQSIRLPVQVLAPVVRRSILFRLGDGAEMLKYPLPLFGTSTLESMTVLLEYLIECSWMDGKWLLTLLMDPLAPATFAMT